MPSPGKVRQVGLPERALPLVSWAWLSALAAGLGMAAAAGVVTRSNPTDSNPADVLPSALVGAGVALAIGYVVIRFLLDRSVVQTLGVPTSLVIIVACGALIGITTSTTDTSVDQAAGIEADADGDGAATIGLGRTTPTGASVGTPRDRERRDFTDLQESVVLLAGLLLLVGAATFLMRRSELRAVERSAVYLRSDLVLLDDEPEPTIDEAALAEALGRSLDELLSQADPRLAIRAAYGSLLNELAALGFARHRYEGPAEHAARCLSAHPLPATSINELLRLFEIARFSELPVVDADADRARRLLTSAIGSLTGVTA